ncbi:tyrosine-type recombinase/integrase [Microbacterium aoyamense]|nr:tyrosine-type recombinase/integrase [Microbacterium aoyamense]
MYRISYRAPDQSQRTKRGFRTKRDAELALAQVAIAKSRGEFIDPTAAAVTVDTMGEEWLEQRRGVLKPSSFRPLESAWRKHVQPKWGARTVGSIRHSEVQSWVSAMTGGSTTVRRAQGVLAGILDGAVHDRRLSRNVARDIALPTKTRNARRHYLAHSQVQTLADHARHPALVLFLAYTGLRWGEATALRIRHVDTLRRRVSVEENAVLVSAEVHVGTPKTHRSRSVPYPEFLALPIAQLAEGKSRDELLFGDGVDYLKLPASRNGWFTVAVRAAQDEDPTIPRVTPHDLRHTAASLAVQAGAHVKAVQRMLGHASAAMTLDVYADLFDDDLDAVATALDQAKRAASVVIPLSRERDRKA